MMVKMGLEPRGTPGLERDVQVIGMSMMVEKVTQEERTEQGGPKREGATPQSLKR